MTILQNHLLTTYFHWMSMISAPFSLFCVSALLSNSIVAAIRSKKSNNLSISRQNILINPRNTNWRGRITTVDLLVLTCLYQQLLILPTFFTFYKTKLLNEEVNLTEASPSVCVLWSNPRSRQRAIYAYDFQCIFTLRFHSLPKPGKKTSNSGTCTTKHYESVIYGRLQIS